MTQGPSARGPAAFWAAAALLAAIGWLAFGPAIARDDDDLEVFLRAGRRVSAGEPLYPPEDGEMAFKYAPVVAFLFVPLAALPPHTASLAWYVISCACLFGSLALTWRVLLGREWPGLRVAAPFLVTLLVGQGFLHYHLRNGQTDALILLLSLAAVTLATRRPALAGALAAAAAAFKVVPLLSAWPALRAHPRRAAAGLGLGAAVGAALPTLAWGPARAWAAHADWVECLLRRTPGDLLYHRNHAIPAFARRAIGDGPLAAAVVLLLVLAVLALVGWTLRRGDRSAEGRAAAAAAVLAAVPLLSPVSWAATCVMLLPALLVLRTGPRRGLLDEALFWTAAVLFNVVGSRTLQDLAPRLWGGLLLLVALALARRGPEVRWVGDGASQGGGT